MIPRFVRGKARKKLLPGLGIQGCWRKTIIQASKYQAQNFSNQEYDEVYEDGSQDDSRNGRGDSPKIYRMPGWLLLIIVLVVAFVVISVLSSVVSMLLPIIIPVFCVVLIVRMLRKGS